MKLQLHFIVSAIILSAAFPNQAFADPASASRQTKFNDLTDYAATFAKTPAERKEIILERQALRREARLQREERKKKMLMRAKMKAQENIILRKIRSQQN